MTDEENTKIEENKEEEQDVTFEAETDGDQMAPQKDLAEKVKKLKKELSECNDKAKEYLDGWQRLKADTVNARKREEEERANFIKFAKSGVVEELLPVLGSFDLAMGNKEAWESVDKNWRAGIEYIAKQFRDVLGNHGLTEMNPLDEVFDPSTMDAIEHVPTDNEEQDHKVVEVIQKGYKLHDRILTPAKVKVGEFKKAS
jgi:molecular chaperone GrpE